MSTGDVHGSAFLPEPPGGLPIESLLRALADGEHLSPEQHARVAEHLERHPGDRALLEADQRLKSACCKAMGCCCPDQIRARVSGMVAAGAAPTPPDGDNEDQLAARLQSRTAETRSRGFWAGWGGPGGRRFLGALAAVLVAGVGGLFVFQQFQASGLSAPALTPEQASYRTTLAQHAAREHNRTAEPDVAAAAFTVEHPETLSGGCDKILGRNADDVVASTDCGLKLVGGGPCELPGGGRAMHVRYERPGANAGDPASGVSLFVREDGGELPMKEGVLYRFDSTACGVDGTRVFSWRRDGFLYVVVAGEPAGEGSPACSPLLAAIGFSEAPVRF